MRTVSLSNREFTVKMKKTIKVYIREIFLVSHAPPCYRYNKFYITERYHGAFPFCSFNHINDLFLHGQKTQRIGSGSSIISPPPQNISTIKLFSYLVKWIWLFTHTCVLKMDYSNCKCNSLYMKNCTAKLPKLRLFILFTADKMNLIYTYLPKVLL